MCTSSTRRCTLAAGLALLLTGAAARPAAGSQDTDWKAFRQAYPFHAQLIAFGATAADGTQTIVLSEPPPWVTFDDIATRYRDVIRRPSVRTHPVGYDGWVKDVTGVVGPLSDEQRQRLVQDLSRDFFGTSYKAFAVDIAGPAAAPESYDLSVSAASLRNWLGAPEPSDVFMLGYAGAWGMGLFGLASLLRRRTRRASVAATLALPLAYFSTSSPAPGAAGALRSIHGGQPTHLASLLTDPVTGVYVTDEPGLVVLVLRRDVPVHDASTQIREFALDSDLVLGGVGSDKAVAIVARERQVPVTTLPPLRQETVLLLAAASDEELAQSYERMHIFAGRTGRGHDDWAPIYLSAQLHDSEYGSLLNITDQLLKGWSEHGEIEYVNFRYPAPPAYPFPTGLLEHAGTGMVTYNWNTKGVGYSDDSQGWDVLSFTRTGALPVDYLGDADTRMREFEDQGYEFFASTARDPNLARVVQYAGLYQIFRHFGLSANVVPSARPHGGPDALLPMARTYLQRIREIDFDRSLSAQALREDPTLAAALEEMKKIQAALDEIAQDDSEPSLDSVAAAMMKPRDITVESMTDAQKLSYGLAHAISSNDIARALAHDMTGPAAVLYVAAERGEPSTWIKTPSIVLSRQIGKNAGRGTGGHNLSSRISRVAIDDSLAPGSVRVAEDASGRTLFYNPADGNKMRDAVRAFARNPEKSPEEVAQLVQAQVRAARDIPTALPQTLRLAPRAPGSARGMTSSRGVTVTAPEPWRYAGSVPSDHARVLGTLDTPSVLPIVVERVDSRYLVSRAGQDVIEAFDSAGALDAVTMAMRQAGDRTVHLHFKGVDTSRASAFTRVTEMHAAGRDRMRLRTSVERPGTRSLDVIGELHKGRWSPEKAKVQVIGDAGGQFRKAVDLEAVIPSRSSNSSLRIRIQVTFREGVRITKEFMTRLAESIQSLLRGAGEDLDVLLTSRRIAASLRAEHDSIADVYVRVAGEAGEIDVVQRHVDATTDIAE